ncbi:MAG: arylesterase [Pseudomonadota bacterium]
MVVCICLSTACSDTNPQLDKLPAQAVILAFGDSITFGTGARPEDSYPAELARLTKRRVINAGVPGEVSAQGRQRLPALLERHQPDLLVLCHGGNDILRKLAPTAIRDNLIAMIEAAQRAGVPVILIGVPKFGLFFLESAPVYTKLAEQYRLAYDGEVLPAIESDNGLKSDPIHPNAAGYRLIADAIHTLMVEVNALE